MIENRRTGLGSLVVSIFKIVALGILAIYAKRNTFTRPFFWFVVQLGAVFAGLIVSVVLMAIFALLGWYETTAAEIICLSVWGLVSLGSISEIVYTLESIEEAMFGNIIQLSTFRKFLGFIYGALMHVWLFNELFF